MAALQEPLHNGGSQKDQDTIVEILRTSAQKDSQPLCRMAAIRALGRFKDPRAAQAIDNEKYLAVIQEWEKAFPGDATLNLISIAFARDVPRRSI